MTTILGIDPGSRFTGFGVIRVEGRRQVYISSGVIKTKQSEFDHRLSQIYRDMRVVMSQYQPDEVAIERVFVCKNARSALVLGEARGAAIAAVQSFDIEVPLFGYEPRLVKKTVVGYGGADKQQVQLMVKNLLGLSAVPSSDAADALAIALCHAAK